MGLEKCVMAGIHHRSILRSIFTALKILCALPAAYPSLPPLQPLETTHFYCLHSFAFSQMSYSLNHREAFSDWLISLSSVHLRFLHVFSGLDSLFPFSAK